MSSVPARLTFHHRKTAASTSAPTKVNTNTPATSAICGGVSPAVGSLTLVLPHLVQFDARIDEADKPSERVQSFEHGLESLIRSRGSNEKKESSRPIPRSFPMNPQRIATARKAAA